MARLVARFEAIVSVPSLGNFRLGPRSETCQI